MALWEFILYIFADGSRRGDHFRIYSDHDDSVPDRIFKFDPADKGKNIVEKQSGKMVGHSCGKRVEDFLEQSKYGVQDHPVTWNLCIASLADGNYGGRVPDIGGGS